MVQPKLSDIPTTRVQFQPGDRLLARVGTHLSTDQYQKIVRAITRWAGVDVRVLIVNCLTMKLIHRRVGYFSKCIAGPEYISDPGGGVANLNCSMVEFKPDDQLIIMVSPVSENQKQHITNWVQRWTGKEVEVIIEHTD